MNVTIKDLQVTMDLGNNGMELQIKDNQGNHLGDLRTGKAKIEWCRGRIRSGNGIKKDWLEIIELIEKSEA